ncbi:MAG: hypothetical protein Q9168_006787 [Polycauliona sp. 1 TL-2023]
MPKAAKPKSRARTSPLNPKSANTAKPPAEHLPTEPTVNENATAEKTIAAPTPVHNNEAVDEANYLFSVAMTLSNDPTITRLLSLPPSLTFGQFHQVLQIAFGWAECHLHKFEVEIQTSEYEPPKRVLQFKPQTFDDGPDFDSGHWPKDQNEEDSTLRDVFERKEWEIENGTKITGQMNLGYVYDLGDSWYHDILLLGRAEKGLHTVLTGEEDPQQVFCFGGEGHPCAEDCGSEPGWEDLKNAFRKPRGDKALRDWYKNTCYNGDAEGLDPYKWDILDVNDQLREVRVGVDT